MQRRISILGWVCLVLALVAAQSAPAAATPITLPSQLVGPQTLIDFNSLAAGNSASPVVLSGVTFSGSLHVIDTDGFGASTSFPTFVSDKALGRPDTSPALPNFTITFAGPVAQVGFGLFDPNFVGNAINAYDSGGVLLESTTPDALFPPGGSGADYLGFVRASADIARIEIIASLGGSSGNVTDALWIDNLQFSRIPAPAPAPAPIVLLSIGLISIGAFQRQRGERG